MFKILFIPRPEWQEKTEPLRKLGVLLFECVADAFRGQHKGGGFQTYANAAIEITLDGVSPLSSQAGEAIVQMIASNLAFYNLDKIFFIRSVQTTLETGSVLVDPRDINYPHYPKLMMEAFECGAIAIPKRFICPITNELINRPAFLESNPKVFYEKNALLKWVTENNTDPITRKRIATVGMTDAPHFRSEICRFIFDAICGKDLSTYYIKEDGDLVDEDNSGKQSPNSHLNSSVTLFSKPSAAIETKGLAEVFFSLKLGHEFIKLAAQALRRAANAGELEEIKVLLSNCGAENIINEKDDNPEKGLTALHYAILKNKVAIVAYLLQEGARTDIPGAKIGTPAELIAASENPEMRSLINEIPVLR